MAIDGTPLKARIETVFNDVKPGRIGLREARALDDRLDEADPAALLAARAKDTEKDWREISKELITASPHVFSFLDDAGFKFVLPAVLKWSTTPPHIHHEVSQYLFFKLLPSSRKARQADELLRDLSLSRSQAILIRDWLLFYVQETGPDRLNAFEQSQLAHWEVLVK